MTRPLISGLLAEGETDELFLGSVINRQMDKLVSVSNRHEIQVARTLVGGCRTTKSTERTVAAVAQLAKECHVIFVHNDHRERGKAESVIAGFAQAESDVPIVPLVPVKETEAWLLADRAVWDRLPGTNTAALPGDPQAVEKVKDPKAIIDGILPSRGQRSIAYYFEYVGQNIDLAALVQVPAYAAWLAATVDAFERTAIPVTETLMDYAEAVEKYVPVLGLETHIELGTASKMFCGCPTTFGAEPNTQVCPVCLGLPGSLPVTNRAAIEGIIKIGLALNCTIVEWSRFARKNYFYPDMPKDYQISQYDEPLCVDGYLDVELDGETYRVEIERVHMEEDTGKSLHVGGSTGRIHGAEYSLVDYNRAGIPLVEIVTKPIEGTGAKAPEVARAYATELRELVRSLGVSDVRMEEGSMRCDVNVSLMPQGSTEWGKRTETKNVNSLRSVERAVRSEIERQAGLLDGGGRIVQETRHFSEATGRSTSGRSKEEAQDYRYFPEPDLVPMAPSREWVEELRSALPELPAARRRRVQGEWGLTDKELQDVVNAGALDLIEETVAQGAAPASARKWWMNQLSQRATTDGVELDTLPISPAQVARVQALVDEGALNDKMARQVIDGVLAGEGEPDEVVAARGLKVVNDDGALLAIIDQVIADNAPVADKVRGGNVAAAGALIGAVMKASRGQADAARARELILEKLTK